MTAVVAYDPGLMDSLIARRRELDIDKWDEVWDGVYVMSPQPSLSHQRMVRRLTAALRGCRPLRTDQVEFGVGVSPLAAGWDKNYRIPDISVVLTGNPLVVHDTHLQGGPDLVVEVRSGSGDRVYEKFELYFSLGVREVLVVDRDSREPALFRCGRGKFARVKATALDGEPWLASGVLPVAFARADGKAGPRLLVRRTAGAARTWRV